MLNNFTEYVQIDLLATLRSNAGGSMTIDLKNLPIEEARATAKDYASKGYDVYVEFSGADDKVVAYCDYKPATGWTTVDYREETPDHKCVIQETPDGMGCVTCLYC